MPRTVALIGGALTMWWGYNCADVSARFGGGTPSTPTTVRGVDAGLVDQPGLPQLFWTEHGICIQLTGFGMCTPAGCRAVDRDQLAAMAESLAPATPTS